MPPKKSNASKIESLNGDSDGSNSNNCASTKPTNKKQPPKRSGDISTSTTTNEPSSASTSIVRARHQAALPVSTAATAPTPTALLTGQKKRKAGFREQFLQKLRVMLDRESQNDDTTVQWSTDGNSFIITDQTHFEEEIIPTYFGNPIVFASFLRKLQRWGFVRVSSIRSGRYEFSSPTFKRMDSRSASSAAAAAAAAATNTTANTFGNEGGGVSIPLPQQQQQVRAQVNQHPMPAPIQLPRQADASAIADLISNIQRQRSTQHPPTSSPQPGPNQVTNQMQTNLADINNILQSIIRSNQHASQLNNVAGINHLQSFPQQQHPNNSTMNLLNSALQSLARGPTPSAQAMGQYPPPSAQSSAVHALMSLSGMLPQSSPLNTAPVASGMSSQPNDLTPVLSLLQLLERFVDEEDQRRVQQDAILNAMLVIIGRISGQGVHHNNAPRPQQLGAPPLSRQSLGSNNNNAAQPNQRGAPHQSIGSLLAALTGDATAMGGDAS